MKQEAKNLGFGMKVSRTPMMAGAIGTEVFKGKCVINRLTFQGTAKKAAKRNYQQTWRRTGNSRGLQSKVIIERKQSS